MSAEELNGEPDRDQDDAPLRAMSPRNIALAVHHAMYSVNARAQTLAAEKYLDAAATFEDPLSVFHTRDAVCNAFRGVSMICSSVKRNVHSVTVSDPPGAPLQQVYVDADITYTLRYIPIRGTLRTVSKFTVDNIAGKVVFHEDLWSLTDLIQGVPLVGNLYLHILRPILGTGVNFLVTVLSGASDSRASSPAHAVRQAKSSPNKLHNRKSSPNKRATIA